MGSGKWLRVVARISDFDNPKGDEFSTQGRHVGLPIAKPMGKKDK
jgi:hypothetical protein